MSRTIIIDANVIDQINRGNKAAADKLLELKRGGNKIWTAHQSHNELIVQPLIPRTAAANALILEEMRIPLAPPGTMRERADTYAKNPLTAGLSEGKDLMLAAQNAAARLAGVQQGTAYNFEIETVWGWIRLTGGTATTHSSRPTLLIIDSGGNDIYLGSPSTSSPTTPRPTPGSRSAMSCSRIPPSA